MEKEKYETTGILLKGGKEVRKDLKFFSEEDVSIYPLNKKDVSGEEKEVLVAQHFFRTFFLEKYFREGRHFVAKLQAVT